MSSEADPVRTPVTPLDSGGVTNAVTPLSPVLTGGTGVRPKIEPTASISPLSTVSSGERLLAYWVGRLTAAVLPMMI